jgi:hypothetical protein
MDPNMEIIMIHAALVERASKPTFMTILASFQATKWLQRLYVDYAELISNSGNNHFRSCCMRCCFDMLTVHSDILSMGKKAISSTSPSITAVQSRKQSPISSTLLSSIGALLEHPEVIWSSRASIIELLSVLLAETPFHDNTEWLELFYISTSEILVQHEKKKMSLNSRRDSSQAHAIRTSVSPKASTTSASSFASTSSISTPSMKAHTSAINNSAMSPTVSSSNSEQPT